MLVHRLCHSHNSQGSVRHVGSHHRGHHAAQLPNLQRHVRVHGGFSGLPGQVSDRNIKDDLLKTERSVVSMVAVVGY